MGDLSGMTDRQILMIIAAGVEEILDHLARGTKGPALPKRARDRDQEVLRHAGELKRDREHREYVARQKAEAMSPEELSQAVLEEIAKRRRK